MNFLKAQSLILAISSLVWVTSANTLACETEYTSGLPSANFTPSIYTRFCAQVDKYEGRQSVSWTVGMTGEMLVDKLLQNPATSPSVDTDSPVSGYTFDLDYNPTNKGVACELPTACAANFKALRSRCTQSGLETNLMTYRGSQGSGCGIFTYYITPPKRGDDGERRCYPLNFFGSHHMRVQEWVLDRLLRTKVCTANRPRVIANEKSTWLQDEQIWINSVPYVFSVYWLEGCYQKQMDVDFNFPIEENKDINCYHLLWDDYAKCLSNDGVGGNITIGCVVYEYKTIDQG